MRALVQRVTHAQVRIDGVVVGRIGEGLCAFVGWLDGDADTDELWMSERLLALRVFADGQRKMNRSLTDLWEAADATRPQQHPGLLLVSQFTLAADLAPGLSKGTRPSFARAMAPELARVRFDAFCDRMQRSFGGVVARGVFGADMKVELINDGPVTLWLDSRGGRRESAA